MRFINSCKGFVGQLARPFSYLAIRHQYKWQMDWLLPGFLTMLSAGVIAYFIPHINIYGEAGVISRVLGFIQNLPGFYIAALAAVATFGRKDIDATLPSPTPTIVEHRFGEKDEIPLTRRRFLCMMFAFLTAECVILILVSIFVLSVGSDITGGLDPTVKLFSKLFFIFYLFFLYQMILATFWSLFYLGDRIHRVD